MTVSVDDARDAVLSESAGSLCLRSPVLLISLHRIYLDLVHIQKNASMVFRRLLRKRWVLGVVFGLSLIYFLTSTLKQVCSGVVVDADAAVPPLGRIPDFKTSLAARVHLFL